VKKYPAVWPALIVAAGLAACVSADGGLQQAPQADEACETVVDLWQSLGTYPGQAIAFRSDFTVNEDGIVSTVVGPITATGLTRQDVIRIVADRLRKQGFLVDVYHECKV
jgi:protein involved in polysaccharide export with SLBB domain